jgi:hypothetical protein
VTTFGPVTQISVHGPFIAGPRSILKPDSFEELSIHDRLIWLEEIATADRLLGSAGGAEAVGVTVGAGPEVKVGVGVLVGVGVALGDGPDVEVRVGVGVRGGVGVRVGVGVAVGGARVVANAVFDHAESPAEL